jgi:aspartate/methionine/tyrosine aminotransferase
MTGQYGDLPPLFHCHTMRRMHESQRMRAVQSPIIPIVGEMIRSCPGTISLGQGIVHYGPPAEAMERLAASGRDPEHCRYTAVQGVAPLIEAIEQKLRNENGIEVRPHSRVIVTAGANMGFYNALLAIADPGDEVILLSPCYFNHEMAIAMANCRAVLVPTDEQYQPQPERLEAAITPRTRAIVTVSPNNPTGAVYPEQTLRRINEICRRNRIYHISDEAYEYFTYDEARHFSSGRLDGAHQYTISLFSLSKAYGFAGWRIGYMVIPEHLVTAVNKAQDTILICPPVPSQYAALGALEAGSDYCRKHLVSIAEVRSLVRRQLEELTDICTVPPAAGAFYFLVRVHTGISDMELVERLVRERHVAVIPGSAFGIQNGCFLRVAYGALRRDTAAEGVGRLVRGLRAIVG